MTNQIERKQRILEAATAALAVRGEDGLQMKEISQKADVSIATLYRYFPSKDVLLMAISLDRYERVLEQLKPQQFKEATAGQRVLGLLLREFSAQQREPMLTAALLRVAAITDRSHAELLDRLYQIHLDILGVAARGTDGVITEAQEALLPLVNHVFTSATRAWIAGTLSAAESRNQISASARLLDLDDRVLSKTMLA